MEFRLSFCILRIAIEQFGLMMIYAGVVKGAGYYPPNNLLLFFTFMALTFVPKVSILNYFKLPDQKAFFLWFVKKLYLFLKKIVYREQFFGNDTESSRVVGSTVEQRAHQHRAEYIQEHLQ